MKSQILKSIFKKNMLLVPHFSSGIGKGLCFISQHPSPPSPSITLTFPFLPHFPPMWLLGKTPRAPKANMTSCASACVHVNAQHVFNSVWRFYCCCLWSNCSIYDHNCVCVRLYVGVHAFKCMSSSTLALTV